MIRSQMYVYRNPYPGKISDSFNNGMKMGDMIRRRKKGEKINEAFSNSISVDKQGRQTFNRAKLLKDLYGIDAGVGMDVQKYLTQQDQAALAYQVKKQAHDLDMKGRVAGNLGNEEGFLNTKNWLMGQGVDVSDMQTYQKNLGKLYADASLPVKDKKELEIKQLEAGIKNKRANIDAGKFAIQKDEWKRSWTPGNPVFAQKAQTDSAEKYGALQSKVPKLRENMALIDDALREHINYSQNSMTGTGPLASGFGTMVLSTGGQRLDAKMRKINFENMRVAFEGMSKAVDSNAERKAWEGTQASFSNDDSVNIEIMLGQKSMILKAMAEAQAQEKHVSQYGDMTRGSYKSPVIGKKDTLINRKGELELVDKADKRRKLKMGYKTVDQYAKEIVKFRTGAQKTGGNDDVKNRALQILMERRKQRGQ